MKYCSAKETAKRWGISQRRVVCLAHECRIAGARLVGKSWMIPSNAEKPTDGRTRASKSVVSQIFFRYPLYVNFEEYEYVPPLSEEEHMLRLGQRAFYACQFDEAKKLLSQLSTQAKSQYIRLSAIYHLLYLDILDNGPNFDTLYRAMKVELARRFPYQREMQLLQLGFEADLGYYKHLIDEFSIKLDYPYHPSSYNIFSIISLIPIANDNFKLLQNLRFDTYEVLCQQMEHEGFFLEAQKLHYLLLIVYQTQNNEERMLFHIRRGLELARDYNLYWNACNYYAYYPYTTDKVLVSFPTTFSDIIRTIGNKMHISYMRFSYSKNNSSFLGLLSSREFEIAFLASQGYTNREISGSLHISESNVAKSFNNIYGKLNISSKQELSKLIFNTHRRSFLE